MPSPWDLPDPGIELGSPALQMDSLPPELTGKPLERSLPYSNAIQECYLPVLVSEGQTVHTMGSDPVEGPSVRNMGCLLNGPTCEFIHSWPTHCHSHLCLGMGSMRQRRALRQTDIRQSRNDWKEGEELVPRPLLPAPGA